MSAAGPEMEDFARSEGVPAHPVPMARQITPLRDLGSLLRMIGTFRSLRPDIVHASTPKGGLLGTIAGRISGVPVVIYHVRGLPYTAASGFQRVLLKTTERIALTLAHEVLCVSQSVRNQLIQDGLVKRTKAVVLASGSSNGVDANERFNPDRMQERDRVSLRESVGIPPDADVIGFVGRLVGDKGVDDLSAAFDSISRSNPTVHLVIVGGWEARDAVSPATRYSLENNPRVHMVGEQRDTAPYYSLMDVLVLPSLREGFPNVPLEGAAMGLPVVTTSVVGCVDAVEGGVTGTIVPPRNPAALAGAISRYLAEPTLRRAHGDAGRKRALTMFEPRIVWTALHEMYRGALARAKA